LLDQNGVFVSGFGIFENEAGAFTPTCAAYNHIAEEYCIAGFVQEPNLPNNPYQSWFLFLDKDLNVINAIVQGVDLTSGGIGPEMNLYVTDITSSEQTYPNDQFLYVGVAGNTSDPSPDYINVTTTERVMYVGYASSSGMGATRAFDYGTPVLNNPFFPSRVIEIPMASPDGGFVITGSGPNNSVFFTRIDYTLANYGATTNCEHISGYNNMYAGDLYFDKIKSEVWFAGTTFGSEYASFIYQKIISLNTAGSTLFSPIIGFTNRFAEMRHADPKFSKISKIMQTSEENEGAIAANKYESTFYSSPNNSYTYPTLNKINYADDNLKDFNVPFKQEVTLYTYPRVLGGNTGLGNYVPYLSYYNLFYPQHNAHHSTPNEEYVMGTSTYDPNNPVTPPEMIALTKTDNFYENECNIQYQDIGPQPYPFNLQTYTPISTLEVPFISFPSLGTFAININYHDCIEQYPFKPNSNLSATNTISTTKSSIIIRSSEANNYRIYNTVGSMIFKGILVNGFVDKDISQTASGVYYVELVDVNGRRVEIKKIVIN